MTNNELTLDQLQSISGGATSADAIEYGLIATLLLPLQGSGHQH